MHVSVRVQVHVEAAAPGIPRVARLILIIHLYLLYTKLLSTRHLLYTSCAAARRCMNASTQISRGTVARVAVNRCTTIRTIISPDSSLAHARVVKVQV